MKTILLIASSLLAMTVTASAGSKQETCSKEEAMKLAYSNIQATYSANIPGMIEMKIVSLEGSITNKSDSSTTDENGAEVRKFFYSAIVQTKHEQMQPSLEKMVGYVQIGTENGQCVLQATEGSSIVSVDLEGNESSKTLSKSKN